MSRWWLLQFFTQSSNRRPGQRARRQRLWLERLEERTVPTTWSVTQPTDNGNGNVANSLSWAIDKANKDSGDTIEINVAVIQPSAAEPTLDKKMTIVGNANTLDGSLLPFKSGFVNGGALVLSGSHDTVEGLTITNFPDQAINIQSDNNVIEDNNLSGNHGDGVYDNGGSYNVVIHNVIEDNVLNADEGFGGKGIHLYGGAHNIIGGTTPAEANVLSGNASYGVLLGTGAKSNMVEGNWIGTDATGTVAIPNGVDGVLIQSGASDNTIGGAITGAGNVISGNDVAGIALGDETDAGTANNVVTHNNIGTNADGTAALPNGTGINVYGGTNATISYNIISGNSGAGVIIQGSGTNQNVVDGNYIGVDRTGSNALGNGGVGVFVLGGAQDNLIGTNGDGVNDATEGNVIAANAYQGVALAGMGTNGNVVAGNHIGTNAAGTAALGNGNNGIWILQGAEGNRIGTNGTDADAAAEGNLISANAYSGVAITDAGTSGNLVAGNWIGTDVTGQASLPNGNAGVYITTGAADNAVSGSNTIAFNTWAGVIVGATAADTSSTGNRIQGNAIFDNGGLGIDLGADGVTPNAPGGPHSGPNDFQNYPVLTTASPGTSTSVTGTFNSDANRTFTLDFYASPAADPSGFGEGQTYLGTSTVTTDSAGNASFSFTFAVQTTENEWITATATDPAGNTSEFSHAVQANTIIPSQLVVKTEPPATVAEYAPFTFAVTAEDDLGEIATNWSGPVTVALRTNPTGATLGGTLHVNASGGVATFSDLTVNTPGSGYVLAASVSGASDGISNAFAVSPLTPAVSVASLNLTYGTALASAQLTGTAYVLENGSPVSIAGTFTYTTAAGTILGAGNNQLEAVTFTPTDTTDFTTAQATVTVNVARALPNVSVSGPLNITYGTALANTQLSGTATFVVNGSVVNVPGLFGYPGAAGTILNADSYTEAVTFTPTDATDYQQASTSVQVNVARATPNIVWPTPHGITYGAALSSTQLDATASWTVGSTAGSVQGSFTYLPGAGTVLGAGTQTLSATFTPTDMLDYNAPQLQTVQLVVSKATPSITWPAPGAIVYGTALDETQLDATADSTVGGTTGPLDGSFAYSPVAGTVLGAGTQTLSTTFTPADSVDYTSKTTSVTINVAAVPVLITPTAGQSKVYGATLPALTYSASGFVNGDSSSILSGVLGTTATASSPVGTYAFALGSLSAGSNYTLQLAANPATFAVTAATLTITPNANQSKLYGAAMPALAYGVSGLVNGDGSSIFSGSLSTTATASSPIGTYPIALGSLSAGNNYTLQLAANPATFAVSPAALTITPTAGQSKVYGADVPSLTYSASGIVNGDDSSVLTGALGTMATASSAVGSYAFTLGSLGAGSNYALQLAANPATFAVTAATLTITPDAGQSKVYGPTLPELTYSASAFVNGDSSSILSGSLGTMATASSPVGSYAFTLGSLSAGSNYALQLAANPPTFAVTAATLTIAPDAGQSKGYSDDVPSLTYSASGFVNGDNSSVLTGALGTTATASSPVRSYAFTLGSLSAGNNYALQLAANSPTFAVTAATLTIAPDAGQSKGYSDDVPSLTYSASGFVNGDNSSVLTGALGTTATASSPVRSYAFTLGSLSAGNNYALQLAANSPTFAVTAATLTIAPDAGQSKGYSDDVPSLTYSASGFVNGDNSSVLTGALGTTATASSPVRSYAFTLGSLSAGNNYALQLAANSPTFAVTAATLTITPDAGQSKGYSDDVPSLTYSASGFVNGDNSSVLTGALGTTATASSPVRSYAFTLGSLSAGNNYALQLAANSPTFAVTAATLTITPDAGQSKGYSDDVPSLTYSASGFVNGDNSSVLTGALGTTATASSPVRSYAFTLGSLSAGNNYALQLAANSPTFAVTVATLTIAPDAGQSKGYSDDVPSLTYSASGFVNGDNSSVLTGALGTTATASSPVRSYAFTLGSLSAGNNYALQLAANSPTFAVTAATLTIAPDAGQSKGYSDDVPSLTYSASGFVNGDNSSVLTGALGTTATASSPVRSYAFTLGSLSAGNNYALQLAANSPTFAVTAATLTIAPDAGQSKGYSDDVPSLTYSASGFVNGDNSSVLTGALGTTATASSPVRSYAFTLGSLSAGNNYALQLAANSPTFAVTAATLTITPDAGQSKGYSADVPTLTYSASGFVNGDDSSILSGSLGTCASAASPPDFYPFNLGTLSAATPGSPPNYNLTLAPGAPTFAVTAGPAGVIATDLPTFAWPATAGASRYTLRVTSGKRVIRTQTVSGAAIYTLPPRRALTPGQTYAWTITPLNAHGKALAPASPPITFTVAALAAPTGLMFSSTTNTFTWMPVTDAGHFSLVLTNSATGKVVLRVSRVATTTYHLTPAQARLLKPGHTYSWHITVISANGKASVSSLTAAISM